MLPNNLDNIKSDCFLVGQDDAKNQYNKILVRNKASGEVSEVLDVKRVGGQESMFSRVYWILRKGKWRSNVEPPLEDGQYWQKNYVIGHSNLRGNPNTVPSILVDPIEEQFKNNAIYSEANVVSFTSKVGTDQYMSSTIIKQIVEYYFSYIDERTDDWAWKKGYNYLMPFSWFDSQQYSVYYDLTLEAKDKRIGVYYFLTCDQRNWKDADTGETRVYSTTTEISNGKNSGFLYGWGIAPQNDTLYGSEGRAGKSEFNFHIDISAQDITLKNEKIGAYIRDICIVPTSMHDQFLQALQQGVFG